MHPKEAFISHGILNPEIARMKDIASLSRRVGSASSKAGIGKFGDDDGSSVSVRGSRKTSSHISSSGTDGNSNDGGSDGGGLTFVYPYGATMTVQVPAHPVLSSGPISYPLNRPVAGVWERATDDGKRNRRDAAGGKGGGARAGGRSAGGGRRAARPEDSDEGMRD